MKLSLVYCRAVADKDIHVDIALFIQLLNAASCYNGKQLTKTNNENRIKATTITAPYTIMRKPLPIIRGHLGKFGYIALRGKLDPSDISERFGIKKCPKCEMEKGDTILHLIKCLAIKITKRALKYIREEKLAECKDEEICYEVQRTITCLWRKRNKLREGEKRKEKIRK